MASDSRTDDTSMRGVRQAVRKLIAALSKAVFGVCAVAVGSLALLLAAGDTGESASLFVVLGVAALLAGVVTISRLPKPDSKPAESGTAGETRRDTE